MQLGPRPPTCGADAFVQKGLWTVREIRAILARLLERTTTAARIDRRVDGILLPDDRFKFAGATIDPRDMTAAFPGGGIPHLNPKEIGILHVFATRAGRLVRRTEILAHVWGPSAIPTSKDALAEQVLDMAKPRQYQFEPVGLHPLIEETTRLLQPAARERNAAIRLELRAAFDEVMADANALRQVLINLVKNALEAGATPAEERVVIVRTRGNDERVFLEVEDNGPGIPDDVRTKLFTPFATSGKRGGLGLGLAICHEITKSHCGSISA